MIDASLYQTLFAALRRRSADELAKAAYGILRMPVIITDTAFVVTAKYPDKPLGDQRWDANAVGRQVDPLFLDAIRDDEHLSRFVQAQMRPVLVNWGSYEDSPRLISLIKSNGSVLGFVCAFAEDQDVTEWHYEAINAIAEAFSILSEADFGTGSRHLDFSAAFLYGMLAGTLTEDAASLRALFVRQMKGPYRLLCFKSRTPYETTPANALKRELADRFDSTVRVTYRGALYVLIGLSDSGTSAPPKSMAERDLERSGISCGASRTFADVSMIPEARWQAERALRVGSVLEPDTCVHRYDDLVADVVLDEVTSRVPLRCAEPPALTALRTHDEENGTEYLATLRCYLLNKRDRKKTADYLHIHRNTLAYRLERIEEIAGQEGCDIFSTVYFALAEHVEAMNANGKGRPSEEHEKQPSETDAALHS